MNKEKIYKTLTSEELIEEERLLSESLAERGLIRPMKLPVTEEELEGDKNIRAYYKSHKLQLPCDWEKPPFGKR